jgi:hypothetical protein
MTDTRSLEAGQPLTARGAHVASDWKRKGERWSKNQEDGVMVVVVVVAVVAVVVVMVIVAAITAMGMIIVMAIMPMIIRILPDPEKDAASYP